MVGSGSFVFKGALQALAEPTAPRLSSWNRLRLEPSPGGGRSEAADAVALWVCATDERHRPIEHTTVLFEVEEFHLEYPDLNADQPGIDQDPVPVQDPLELAKVCTAEAPLLDFDQNSCPVSVSSASELSWQ